MIAKDADAAFASTDIYLVGYTTPRHGGKMTMTNLAEQIVNRMQTDRVFERHKQVIFVAHSLGGLLVEQILLDFPKDAPSDKVRAIFFYGTPHEGSHLANFYKFFSSDPLVKELQAGDDNLILRDVDQRWAEADLKIKQFCAYEKRAENGAKVVDEYSATRGDCKPLGINTDHRNLVKPCSERDDSFTFLQNGLRAINEEDARGEAHPSSVPNNATTPPYADPNQPWVTGPIAPGMGVYFQLTRLHQRLMDLQSSWATTIRGIQIELYEPYKSHQVSNPPTVMPDNLQDNLAEHDREYAEQYRKIEPDIVTLRNYAIACMQPTPNELSKDQDDFMTAEHSALKSIPVADLRTGRPDMNRFLFIASYVVDLRTRLGNFHCDIPSR